MDAKQFLAEFGHIVNAPGGVQRVKESVLQLAIQAKLTNQSSQDTPAELWFKKNQQERTQLIAKGLGLGKRQKPLSPMNMREAPWKLPDTWKWCYLGEVTSYGTTDKTEYGDVEDDCWVLELEDIEKQTSNLLTKIRAKDRQFLSSKNRFSTGFVLYGKLRPYLDKVIIADEGGVCTTEIMPIRVFSGLLSGYLRWYLKTPYFISYATNSTHGMNLPRMGTESGRTALFPLPPLEEQKRIVAKVDELMALCDKLETQQQKRRELQALTRTTALDALANAQSAQELKAAWLRIQDHLPLLLDGPEDISDLRRNLIQIAILGNYTTNKNHTTTADDLLKDIANEKLRLINKKAIKKPRPLSEIKIGEIPFELPKDWKWTRLGEITKIITSGSRGWAKYYSNEGAIFIGMGNLSKGDYKLRLNNVQHVDPPKGSEGDRTQLESGDILISITGDVGMLGFIPEEFGEAYINQHTCLVRLMNGLENRYFAELLRTPLCIRQFNEPQRGIKNSFRLSDVAELFVPLPPTEEQKKILTVIDKQMQLCDQLEKQLTQAQRTSEKLAESAISAITGTHIKDKKTMKAPETELVTKLKLAASPNNQDHAPLCAILTGHSGELSSKALWNYSGLTIDGFYQQLKIEMARGWIVEPQKARVIEKASSPKNAGVA